MKIVTANRLSDGRVIYADTQGEAVERLDRAGAFEEAEAEVVLAGAAGRPDLFVNPYLVEVQSGVPSGRDRLKETIRSRGPTVGNSLPRRSQAIGGIV